MIFRNPRIYYLVLLSFPIWFLLHVINENFWLIPVRLVGVQLAFEIALTLGVGFVLNMLITDRNKAFLMSFLILSIYFLFGAFKDLIDKFEWLKWIRSYSILLPLLCFLIVAISISIKKSRRSFEKPVRFILAFLFLNVIVEGGIFIYKHFSGSKHLNDRGDLKQEIANNVSLYPTNKKPDVFWLIFDQYGSSNSLKKVWGYINPLDSFLRFKGFFIADSAKSNYNYTPYSLSSTLDMQYLRGYKNHSHVGAKDIASSTYAIKENNVISIFEKLGYKIHNYSIYDFERYPTKGNRFFDYIPKELMRTRTLTGRLHKNIGWHLNYFFSKDKKAADSVRKLNDLLERDGRNDALIERSIKAIHQAGSSILPGFYLLHFQIPHEPYMYDSSGRVQYKQGIDHSPKNYLKHLSYTNQVISRFADSLVTLGKKKNIAVIISGDHGFKFDENSEYFDTESCKTLYAVYCTDKNYSMWYKSVSSVNTFRILFNKYFDSRLPLMKDTSYNLYYRKD